MYKALTNNIPDLKNTTDDALPVYLNSLGFVQSHTLTDVRLGLGYSAFALCAATFYWDYTYGFDSTKFYTTIAVAVYTILNTALTFWIWGVEKNTVYVGTHKTSGTKIQVQTKTDKFKAVYRVTVITTTKDGKSTTKKVDKAFSGWFDAAGHFVTRPFQQMLATNVELIGQADPKNVVVAAKKEKVDEVEDNRSMDDKWASLLAESSIEDAVTSGTPAKSAKKRGKKA
ncbi:putative Signal peptidase complex subunit SPC2 [Glarea lozoyensis 74030]|uniref:Signal peptidase complex subunit 2 n=1 Tax=Glarea lozoyensis (strain ATCC 74030 / MF5533) TaxID=1104152 RepID=H0EGA8_GLAL7|nr:putative Signal peptidase complex subunit SPC2 [Glarea lozoyensis 74030]